MFSLINISHQSTAHLSLNVVEITLTPHPDNVPTHKNTNHLEGEGFTLTVAISRLWEFIRDTQADSRAENINWVACSFSFFYRTKLKRDSNICWSN